MYFQIVPLKSALENQLLFPSWPGENLTALWDADHWDMCHLFWRFLVDETRKSCDSLIQLPFKTWSSPVRSNFTETCNLLWSFNSLRWIIWKMIHSLVLHTLDQPTLHKHLESHSVYIYIIPLDWTSLNRLGINESSPPPPFPTSPGPNGKSTSQRRGQGPRLTCRLSRLKLLQWTTSHPRQRWRPTVPHGKLFVDQTWSNQT